MVGSAAEEPGLSKVPRLISFILISSAALLTYLPSEGGADVVFVISKGESELESESLYFSTVS